ncbi:FeoB small GTPase domain-containing protein, partial [Roseateles sp. GG27B]
LDATNLRRNLRLLLAVKRLGLPCIAALNMADLAAKRGLTLDVAALSQALGVPVVRMVATQGSGVDELRAL